jgi:lysophospholipid acyltransferase (LPLAT)-like uncharacterized protein
MGRICGPHPRASPKLAGIRSRADERNRRYGVLSETMFRPKRLTRSRTVQQTIGFLAAEYLRLVWRTTRFTLEPSDPYERWGQGAPNIITFWHGQHFLTPFVKRPGDRGKALISRHRDGEINAIAAERLGIGTIRGSGDHGGRFIAKGGVSAVMAMIEALKQGYHIGLTADVPKRARVAGMGIIRLAGASGSPILPIAIATRRRIELNNWDRTAINLPFGPGAIVIGDPIRVAADASPTVLEAARSELEKTLNAITARVYAILDK